MAWDDDKSSGDIITSSDYNIRTDLIKTISGSHFGFSGNARNLFHPSGLIISGQEYSQAYASAQRVKDLFDSELYSLSSNLYNRTWINTFSGNVNWIVSSQDAAIMPSRSDGDVLTWDTTQNKWSSQSVATSDVAWSSAADFYGFSSNARVLFYPSSLGKGISSNVKILDDWFEASSSKISDFVASGDEYSAAYASAQILKDMAFQSLVSSNMLKSGTTYTNIHDWWVASGESYSKAYASAQIASYDAGGISGWYDLDTGTGITAFGGAVAISGTQAETLSVAGYIASSTVIANYVKSANAHINFYPSSLGKGVSGAVLANTLHSANSALHTFSVESYMTSANIIANYIKSANAISRFADSANVQTKFIHSGLVLNAVSSLALSGGTIKGKYTDASEINNLSWGIIDAATTKLIPSTDDKVW